MSSAKSFVLGVTASQPSRLEEALEAIETVASMLSRPEVVACLNFLREAGQVAESLQVSLSSSSHSSGSSVASDEDAVDAVLYQAINAVTVHEAIKAIAAQDSAKASAIQYAVKLVALREAARGDTFSENEIRTIVSAKASDAIAILRRRENANHLLTERRSKEDRRRHH